MENKGLRIVQSENTVDVLYGEQLLVSADKSLDVHTEFQADVPEIGYVEVIVYGGISPVVVVGVNPNSDEGFPIECEHGDGTFRLMVACATQSGYTPVAEVDIIRDQTVDFKVIS